MSGWRTLLDGPVRLRSVSVGPMDNNVYLLAPDSGPALLIDAAAEADRLAELLAQTDGVGTIATTHLHHDHIGALPQLAQSTDARCVAGADAAAIAEATGVAVERLRGGDTLTVGPDEIEVIELRGHTPGGACYVWHPAGHPVQLFTGDSLFPGGVGKTAHLQDFRTLLANVTERLFDRFDDDAVVWPGHGDPTTLGAERPHLGEWRERGW